MDSDIEKAIVKPSRFVALTYRDFRLFWFGQFTSNVGTQMLLVAVNWHIYLLTHSPVALGLIGFMRFLPIVLFSLIGGSFADTHNRKKVIIVCQIIFAILSATLALTTFSHKINPIIIYLVTVVQAATLSFDMPSRQALVPSLVDKKHLANAMSINAILFQTGMILGPSIAGVLIARFGVGTIYAIDAVSYVAVICGMLLIHTSGDVEGKTSEFSFSAILEGLHYVRSKTIIWSTMLLDFFSTFFSSATALLPIFAKDILQVGPQELGLLYAAPSIGAVLAGFAMAHAGTIKKQGKVLLVAVGFYAVGTIIFGLSKQFLLSLIALIIVGAGDAVSMIIRNTIRQLSTPDYIRGRMSSVNMIFFMGGPQLGEFEAGLLAALFTAPASVVIGGIATLFVVAIVGAKINTLRNYESHLEHS